MTESLAHPGSVRRLSVGEEILNAVSHGAGALLAVAGTVLLVLRAKAYGGLVNLVSVTVFGASMILLYLASCLYHALPPSKGKHVLQVLDHCSIFLLILGTYAPVSLVVVGGALGWALFGVNLACALAYTVGVVFYRQKDKPYRHGIWHFFVLAGTVFHFFAVYIYCCF